jgi:collagenase-like PrtC family protease
MNKKDKVELLLPAGSVDALRAAVNNGADAVYLGFEKFNARISANNFDIYSLYSAVKYCHSNNVKVYVVLNTLIKNDEIDDFLYCLYVCSKLDVDAVIIQSPSFIPIIKEFYPNLKIHLSTQAGVNNKYSIPNGIDRVILAREIDINEIKIISDSYETEVFVHGALCICFSGQCLFSSIAGGRSGNRGRCAQPCRKKYNNKYVLSTKDLCLIEEIPKLIESNVYSFKVEGRLKSPLYVGVVAKIYRKYIDFYYECKKNNIEFKVDEKDINLLKLVFNREFTKGYAFEDSIVDSRNPMNRGLYLGKIKGNCIKLKDFLNVGDGISIWDDKGNVSGRVVDSIFIYGKKVFSANKGDVVSFGFNINDYYSIYKTYSENLKVDFGDKLELCNKKEVDKLLFLSKPINYVNVIKLFNEKKNCVVNNKIDNKINKKINQKNITSNKNYKLFVKVYNYDDAIKADKEKVDIIYYDLLNKDFCDVKKILKYSELFADTPFLLSTKDVDMIFSKIKDFDVKGMLVRNRGLLKKSLDIKKHLYYNLNCFNDLDILYNHKFKNLLNYASLELNYEELKKFKSRDLIIFSHGYPVLMTLKEKLKCPELVDDEERHFRVRDVYNGKEILNNSQIAFFEKIYELNKIGYYMFALDLSIDVIKYIRFYRNVMNGIKISSKDKKGFTLCHFLRGVD